MTQEVQVPTGHPAIARYGALDMQVCVPADWSDRQVLEFAEGRNPCGTEQGWMIRADPKRLAGCPVRNPCALRPGFVHVTLDA